MPKEQDLELRMYEILNKLKKANVYDILSNFLKTTILYFDKEWGYENLPTEEEIIDVVNTFVEGRNFNFDKIIDVLNKEDLEDLVSFMIISIDIIIHEN